MGDRLGFGKISALLRRARPPRRPAPAEGADGLVIEYTPCIDGDPDPGEVVWSWVPYEDDPSQGKDRPVVIVGRRGQFLAGVALTSKPRNGDHERVYVGTGAWDPQGRPSYAKLDRVLGIDPSEVRREGAILERERFDDLVAALRRVHGVIAAPRPPRR